MQPITGAEPFREDRLALTVMQGDSKTMGGFGVPMPRKLELRGLPDSKTMVLRELYNSKKSLIKKPQLKEIC